MNPKVANRLMLAFSGSTPPPEVQRWLATRDIAGFTLFGPHNVETPAQVRALTAALQAARPAGTPPLLIAADQEGGQLLALGEDVTQFAGNMALGAAGDADLAQRVGHALGREMRALGVNVNYAPNCDINTNPDNPACGIRAFGDAPAPAAALAAATVRGLQAAGVAATIKHFPGKGDARVDSHYRLPLIDHSRERLLAAELQPFQAALAAGAKLVMTGHFAIPALTGSDELPATLSRAVMHDFLRGELGFDGIIISDAIDMGALTQGAGQIIDMLAAIRADVDLLLTTVQPEVQERLYQGLQLAYSRRLIDDRDIEAASARITALRRWVGGFAQPALEVVGCAEHRQLAAELAQKSITLLRDAARLLPLRLPPDARLLAVMPRPQNLTPADTSERVRPQLAEALRRYHHNTEEWVVAHTPADAESDAVSAAAAAADVIVVGTLAASANPAQAALVNRLLALGKPVVTLALRTPYDLRAYPQAATHLCTYGILRPTLDALAAALFGQTPLTGRLPVALGDLYPRGHGLCS